jgi:hypothetical protein
MRDNEDMYNQICFSVEGKKLTYIHVTSGNYKVIHSDKLDWANESFQVRGQSLLTLPIFMYTTS